MTAEQMRRAAAYVVSLHEACDPPKGGFRLGSVMLTVAAGHELANFLDDLIEIVSETKSS